MAQRFTTEDQITKFKNFYETNTDLMPHLLLLEKSVSTAEMNLAWREKHMEIIIDAMSLPPSISSGIILSFNIILMFITIIIIYQN